LNNGSSPQSQFPDVLLEKIGKKSNVICLSVQTTPSFHAIGQLKKLSQNLLVNFLHKPPAWLGFDSEGLDHPAAVEPFQFSTAELAAYEES